jgi:A/G-specific adenine glycosylase
MNSAIVLNPQARSSFRKLLLAWYDSNRRDLPWRHTKDPYRIWISEIMLQQTRVGAVLDHYRRFLDRFPNVQALARAREQSLLAVFSLLGYYRRARHMHSAAQKVVAEWRGEFPRTTEQLRQLPGIGRYTSAAIASIAFDEPVAVVDGNVERVLSRIAGRDFTTAQTWQAAQEMLAPKRPGDFNQAMMELGAMVCVPREPKCLTCVLLRHCATRGSRPSGKREVRNAREIGLALVKKNGAVWLVQRPPSASLMPGMWELPEFTPDGGEPAARFRHSILNTDYEVSVYLTGNETGRGKWARNARLPGIALTGMTRKILRHFAML